MRIPHITNDDAGTISVSVDGTTRKSWEYTLGADAMERQKVQLARAWADGWMDCERAAVLV